MRLAGKAAAAALHTAGAAVRPGVDTLALDTIVRQTLKKFAATPSFLHYNGFPAAACISINHQVIHGIPAKAVVIREGDLVKIDVGAIVAGFHGDCADTFFAGEVTAAAKHLYAVTRQSFYEGMVHARTGNRIGDISHAIQSHVEDNGYAVIEAFVGHGIGQALHEDPEVPNYGAAAKGARLCEGMTLAIEPMVSAGKTSDIYVLDDDWTVVTADNALSCHYENTIVITENGPEILTVYDGARYGN